MPTLADIYSAIDSAKRKGSDFVRNPGASLQQMVGLANDRAGALNELTSQAASEGLNYGPKSKQLANQMAEGYNPVGMFIGPNAASFNKLMATKAMQLEKSGKTPEEIWEKTGTFRGPDKQWRQEISDKGSAITDDVFNGIKANQEFKGSASQALTHPELYAAYPDVAKIKSGLFANATPEGSYHGSTDTILAGGPSTGAQRSAMLHEIQHAIQQREGFARGGNVNSFTSDIAQAKYDLKEVQQKMVNLQDKAADEARFYISKSQKDPEFKKYVDDAFKKYKTQFGEKSKDNPFGVDLQDAVKFNLLEQSPSLNNFGLEAERLRKLSNLNPEEGYRRLAGEAEARAVQARRQMSPEEQRAIYPLQSYDVPIKDLIFK
jgi:hypothetical protein